MTLHSQARKVHAKTETLKGKNNEIIGRMYIYQGFIICRLFFSNFSFKPPFRPSSNSS